MMNKLIIYYKKYNDILLYIFFGVLTTAVNFAFYFLLARVFLLHIVISNITAWFGAVIFAFFTNRTYVFKSQGHSALDIIKEFILFVLSRCISGGLDTILLYIMVSYLHIYDLIAKAIIGLVVIVINYGISKFFIFNKSKN